MDADRRRTITTMATLGACCAIIGSVAVGPAFGACKIVQITELSVTVTNNRPTIDGEINGEHIKVLVDTGAALSVLWRSEAKRLGLPLVDASRLHLYGVGGETFTQQTLVKQFRLNKFAGRDLRLFVAGEGPHPPGGASLILGEDFFSHYTVEFDLAHGAIRLLQPEGCQTEQLAYWATAYSMATLERSTGDQHRIETLVLLNGKAVRAILDSGAQTSIVSTDAAARAEVLPETGGASAGSPVSGFGRKSVESWVGTFGTFAIGDEQIRNAKLRIADMFRYNTTVKLGSHIAVARDEPSMLIGADFFLSHRLIVPAVDRKIVFTYGGGPVFQTVHQDAEPADAPSPAEPPPPMNSPPPPPS
jgi:hypothetical protein